MEVIKLMNIPLYSRFLLLACPTIGRALFEGGVAWRPIALVWVAATATYSILASVDVSETRILFCGHETYGYSSL